MGGGWGVGRVVQRGGGGGEGGVSPSNVVRVPFREKIKLVPTSAPFQRYGPAAGTPLKLS